MKFQHRFRFSGGSTSVVNSAPVNTVLPAISGSTTVGGLLSSTTGSWSGWPLPTYTFQWKRNGVDIAGATESTYTSTPGDASYTITVSVTATNTAGSASVSSSAYGPINSVPVNTVLPVITGGTTVGSLGSVSTGTWSGYPAPTFSYQWRRNGTILVGFTSPTYTYLAGDEGATMSVTVVATNSAGSGMVTSASVGPITANNTAPVIEEVLVGTLTGNTRELSVIANAVDGNTVYWVVIPEADTVPSDIQVAAGQNHLGVAATESGSGIWPGPFTDNFVSNIARANYKVCLVISNGAYSNVGVSLPFEIDTLPASLSSVSFTDNLATGLSRAFTANEDGTYRWSIWPASTDPVDGVIDSGTGALFTGTGTATSGVPVTGTVGTGAGIFQGTIAFTDSYGNKTYYTSSNVTVTNTDARVTTALPLGWYSSDTTTRSGTDVIVITDKSASGAIDLTARPNPPFTTAIQQSAPSAILDFASGAVRGIQSPGKVAANRRMMTTLSGGGSIRLFAALDTTGMVDGGTNIFYSESDSEIDNQSIWFGVRSFSGSIDVSCNAKRFSDGANIARSSGLSASAFGLCIVEYLITPTVARVYRNGVQLGADLTTTPGNFPNVGTCRITFGSRASNTAQQGACLIDVREVYVTGTTDDTTANYIRAVMANQWGIIL